MLQPTHDRYQHQSIAQLHRGVDRLFQPLFNARLDQQTVDHHFDRVVLTFIKLDAL